MVDLIGSKTSANPVTSYRQSVGLELAKSKVYFKYLQKRSGMKKMILLAFLLLISISSKSQTKVSTAVNSDGTVATVYNNGGNTSTQVNSDGTHSVIIHHGKTSTKVNPNGTHSIIFHNGGNTSTQINPDGTLSFIFYNGNTLNQGNSDRKSSVSIYPRINYDKRLTKSKKRRSKKDRDAKSIKYPRHNFIIN